LPIAGEVSGRESRAQRQATATNALSAEHGRSMAASGNAHTPPANSNSGRLMKNGIDWMFRIECTGCARACGSGGNGSFGVKPC